MGSGDLQPVGYYLLGTEDANKIVLARLEGDKAMCEKSSKAKLLGGVLGEPAKGVKRGGGVQTEIPLSVTAFRYPPSTVPNVHVHQAY